MKKKITAKRILLSLLAVVLAALAVYAVVFFRYLPHYRGEKEPITVTPAGENRMMSCNLRYISPTDLGQRSWFRRADLIVAEIENQAPGIIGFQEATPVHYDYLVDVLPQYDSVITYRDKSIAPEGCPIFYHKDRYTLVDKGSFWLSETPDVMSKGWDAACYRICSYVILTDKASGKDFVVFNTHLDHVSDTARVGGIQVVLEKIAQFGGLPSVIMGDFNALEGSETYLQVTENFLDARYQVEYTGQNYTYQNWGNEENFKRLDYFMISMSGIEVSSYCVLPALHDGIYSTDHCPIVLQATLN
jgi:endonuclease/exonuclease/phosphatase family metal-dependent hydrolase